MQHTSEQLILQAPSRHVLIHQKPLLLLTTVSN